jgi:hypothetical protein
MKTQGQGDENQQQQQQKKKKTSNRFFFVCKIQGPSYFLLYFTAKINIRPTPKLTKKIKRSKSTKKPPQNPPK